MIESLLSMLVNDDSLSAGRRKNIAELYKHLFPHRFLNKDDQYGRNSLLMLMGDLSISESHWPPVSKSSVATAPFASKDILIKNALATRVAFYDKIFDKMLNEYVDMLKNKGVMKSFDDIVKKVPLIDVRSLFDIPDAADSQPEEYKLPDGYFDNVLKKGWYLLIPCFKNITIQVNAKRFINIETLKVNKREQSIKFKINDYCGRNDEWILLHSSTLNLKINNDLSSSVDENNVTILSYERILTDYISEMHWDKKHQNLWRDVFGLYDMPDGVCCDFTVTGDFDDNTAEAFNIDHELHTSVRLFLPDPTYFNKLKAVLRSFPIRISDTNIMSHEETNALMTERFLDEHVQRYGKLIACINKELYSRAGQINAEKPDSYGRYKRQYDDIIIHSELEPTPANPN